MPQKCIVTIVKIKSNSRLNENYSAMLSITHTTNYNYVAFDKSCCKGELESVSIFVIEELDFDRDQRRILTTHSSKIFDIIWT